jgi:hypothetical protein
MFDVCDHHRSVEIANGLTTSNYQIYFIECDVVYPTIDFQPSRASPHSSSPRPDGLGTNCDSTSSIFTVSRNAELIA